MNIGKAIKEIRNEKKITQERLAKESGLSVVAIRQYESGVRNPNTERLKKITDVLGVSIADLWYMAAEESDNGLQNSEKGFQVIDRGETQLLNDYRRLNPGGQAEAQKRVSELTEIQRYTIQTVAPAQHKEYLLPNAAHEVPGATPEQKAAADALMDDDAFWK